jgi:hypothetical protein
MALRSSAASLGSSMISICCSSFSILLLSAFSSSSAISRISRSVALSASIAVRSARSASAFESDLISATSGCSSEYSEASFT